MANIASLDAPGEWFLGAITATEIVVGRDRALVIKNSNPPTVEVHGGVIGTNSELFGNGADGTPPGDPPLILTEDTYYENLTVPDGFTLVTDGFRLFVRDTLTLHGTISGSGNPGSNGNVNVPGAAGAEMTSTNRTLGMSGAGSGGADAAERPVAPGPVVNSLGGSGGAGGDVNAVASRDGGTASAPAEIDGGYNISNDVIAMHFGRNLSGAVLNGGAGGCGGAGGTEGGGGGGGSGGRVVVVAAGTIVGAGAIRADGGNGGNGGNAITPALQGGGGGGGGGGGAVVLIYKDGELGFTLSAAGGLGGLGGQSLDDDGIVTGREESGEAGAPGTVKVIRI